MSNQRRGRSSRVLIPGLVDHQPKSSDTMLLFNAIEKIVLSLFLSRLIFQLILVST